MSTVATARASTEPAAEPATAHSTLPLNTMPMIARTSEPTALTIHTTETTRISSRCCHAESMTSAIASTALAESNQENNESGFLAEVGCEYDDADDSQSRKSRQRSKRKVIPEREFAFGICYLDGVELHARQQHDWGSDSQP